MLQTFLRNVGLGIVIALANISISRAGTLISSYGKYEEPGKTWKVEVSQEMLSVSHNPMVAVSPKWEASSGWFVFVESTERIWAYDGDGKLLFDETTLKGGRTSELKGSFDTITKMPPKEVYDQLPAKMQDDMHAKFPTGH